MKEQDLREVASLAFKALEIVPCEIRFRPVQKGRCNGERIIMPNWIFEKTDEFQIYYMIHECTHLKVWEHGKEFQVIETILLKDWGIIPKYSRAYPKVFYYANGQTICDKYGNKKG
jgi:predicted metal-dependent hydrolase